MDDIITSIETIAIRLPLDIWAPPPMSHGLRRTHFESLYVKVVTGDGLVGWGESLGSARPMVVAAYDHWIRRLAVGQKASDATLMTRIARTVQALGRSGPMIAALSGLDIALWDLRGKREGASVSTLLGGARRTRIECYASLLQYSGDAEHLKRNTVRALEHGFRSLKLHERTPEAVAVARQAIGPGVRLMVDTNCAWTLPEAGTALSAMKPYDPYWVEEPLYPPEDLESLAQLRDIGVPLAIGENASCLPEFRRMAMEGRADFIQPSIVKMGGVTALSRISAEVEKVGATCVPNVFYIGPGFLAVLHCLAAQEREAHLERLFGQLAATPYAKSVPIVNGEVEVPAGPGLGADPEEELIEEFRA